MHQTVHIPRIEPGQTCEFEIEGKDSTGLSVHYLVRKSEQINPEGALIIFAPAKPETDKTKTVFYADRLVPWTFENFDLIYVSDPAAKIGSPRKYTLGILPEIDCAELISDTLSKLLGILGHRTNNLRFFGYDHGGFLAIQVATFFPQPLVFTSSPITEALGIIAFWEKEIQEALPEISGQELKQKFPSRNNVWDRILENKRIPQLTILTHQEDYFNNRLHLLISRITNCDDQELVEIGDCRLLMNNEATGHKIPSPPLLKKYLDGFVKEEPVFFPHPNES